MCENTINLNEYYSFIESVPKYESFVIYTKSIFIGIWVLLKWFLFFLWKHFFHKPSIDQNDYDVHHDKPPSVLIDNSIGSHAYIKIKGIKFHYVEAGTVGNPVIILLHGFPDCWIGWQQQIKKLSHFFHVIALDLKGFNDSDKPMWQQAYSPKQICEEIRQFIFSLEFNNVTIIGHDLGGVIGWYLAHTNSNKIERFICISTPHPNLIWQNLNSKYIINNSWLQYVQLPWLPELDHFYYHTSFFQKCLNFTEVTSFNNKIKISSEKNNSYSTAKNLMNCYKYVFNNRTDWRGALNYYRNFPFYRIESGCIIRCPVLIITGNEDDSFCLESMVKSTEFCKNSILKIIERAGHRPHQQTAEEVNKIILNFLIGKQAKVRKDVENNSKGIVGRMFGVVSNTVKIGSVLDSMQQTTNNVLNKALY